MSDNEGKPEHSAHSGSPITIGFDEAVFFFETVCEDAICAACSKSEWEISTVKNNDDVCFLRKSGLAKGGVPVMNLELECLHCGLLRHHRADRIRNWLDAPRPEESDDEQV